MNRFDILASFGHWQYWEMIETTPEDLLRHMDRNGIARAACMSLRGLVLDWRDGNAESFSAAKAHPDRLVAAATISPHLGGGAASVREVIEQGARLIRLYPAFHHYRFDGDFIGEVCHAAGEASIPVMIPTRPMMNWRFKPLDIETIGKLAAAHPGTQFVLSGPNYLSEFQALMRVMRTCPNTWYECSCLQGYNAIRKAVDEVGAERLLFGTGAVLHYASCNVAKLDGASINPDERETIARGNALRLLGLT